MKISEAITYHLAKSIDDLSQTKWNKLMFFLDAISCSRLNKQFTNFEYVKLPYGPVPDNYKSIISDFMQRQIIDTDNYSGFTDSVMYLEAHDSEENEKDANEIIESTELLQEALDQVIEVFGDWSAVRLSDFSHQLDAWKNPEMFQEIDMKSLKNDSFLLSEFKEESFADLVLN